MLNYEIVNSCNLGFCATLSA